MDKLLKLVSQHPAAKIVAHPESDVQVLELADFVGSTAAMLRYVSASPDKEFIVATEAGILHQMKKEAPGKVLIPAPARENNTCACSECPYMKMNTVEKLYNCLKTESPEIFISETLQKEALLPISRMLKLSAMTKQN